jgi:hypothetical protein
MGFNLRITLLFFSMLISFLCQTPTEASPTYIDHACINTTTSTTPNGTYRSNLLQLLSYLSSNATSNLEFYNASVGNSVDTVYGLFLCRGNVPAADCRDCVAVATKQLVDSCPEEKAAVVWYADCMIHYSNRYIFSTMVSEPSFSASTQLNVSEPNRFDDLVMAMMNDFASLVTKFGSGAKKFSTNEAQFTASQTLHTIVQCTPDLSGYDCNRCLQIAIKNLSDCCSGKSSGIVTLPSCILAYNVNQLSLTGNTSAPTPNPAPVNQFYLTGNTPAPTPNPAPVPPPPSSGIIFLFLFISFLWGRRKNHSFPYISRQKTKLRNW